MRTRPPGIPGGRADLIALPPLGRGLGEGAGDVPPQLRSPDPSGP